jgi:hypothetical protein
MWPLLALALASPAAAGLFGPDAPSRIPIPARLFVLEVEDVGGTTLRIERATYDGEVFLFGTMGLAQVTVPFELISSVVIAQGPDDDHRTAIVSTATQEEVRVVLEVDRPLYGRTAFGNYKIEVGQIRRISVVGAP